MSVFVINPLQPVKIEQENRERLAGASVAFDLVINALNQQPVIRQTGERVANGKQPCLLFLVPALGNFRGENQRHQRLNRKERLQEQQ